MNWKRFKERLFAEPTNVLALSGGGARGMAHIGVLRHLDYLSLKPELVTGTSMGAVVGALYCLNGSSEGLRDVVHDLFVSELFQKLDLDDLIEHDRHTDGAELLHLGDRRDERGDRGVGAEHRTGSDPEEQAVSDLTGSTNNQDVVHVWED